MAGDARYNNINRDRFQQGRERRAAWIEEFRQHYDIDKACEAVGVTRYAYRQWRARNPEFCMIVDAIKPGKLTGREEAPKWEGGFASFRKRYFGMDTPAFQQEIIHEYERTPLGNILMILMPPEHGKTTIFEDYASYKLATHPNWRFGIASEKQGMSKKVLGRVKKRMGAETSFPDYREVWGPFQPQAGDRQQPWGADYFNVYRKTSDDRDYSMAALGIDGQVAGSRFDHLHADDMQSKRNLNLTPKIVETFQQDWLTRPGEHGITTINGTRVGEGDIYEEFDELWDDRVLKIVRLPAITYDPVTLEEIPLWPERYNLEQLHRMEIKVGDEAWSRNYMQNPAAAKNRTFDDDAIAKSCNPMIGFHTRIDPMAFNVVTIDPSIGNRNGMASLYFNEGRCVVRKVREDRNLMSNEAILNTLEGELLEVRGLGGTVNEVVIETMAFQKGLAADKQLLDLVDVWGFAIRPHLTGLNKYDPDIGVPSMVADMRAGRLELAWADDPQTQTWMKELHRQMKAWRPGVRGNKLRQDLLMAVWFGWIRWKVLKGGETQDTSAWQTQALPWHVGGITQGIQLFREPGAA